MWVSIAGTPNNACARMRAHCRNRSDEKTIASNPDAGCLRTLRPNQDVRMACPIHDVIQQKPANEVRRREEILSLTRDFRLRENRSLGREGSLSLQH